MSNVRTLILLAGAAALAAGCKWKTNPDTYRIDCNVPYAKVFVYDRDGELLSTQNAGEFFPDFDEKGQVEVKADGYYTYAGPVSQLQIHGKKSWYVELRRRRPGDQEPE